MIKGNTIHEPPLEKRPGEEFGTFDPRQNELMRIIWVIYKTANMDLYPWVSLWTTNFTQNSADHETQTCISMLSCLITLATPERNFGLKSGSDNPPEVLSKLADR